nr:glycosyltransferase family A protein [uncultured Butyrivibrio sp.]
MNFSVIVPVHNAENYIKELMDSLLTQDFYEIILIENGSEDNSPAICDDYSEKEANVSCYHYGRIGAFRARREGIKKASGDYLLFADADDVVSSTMRIDLLACLDYWQHEGTVPDIILYNAADYNKRDNKLFSFPFDDRTLYQGDEKNAFYKVMCGGDSLNAMWNKAIKRNFAEETETFTGLMLSFGEDLLQTAEYLDKAKSLVYLDKALYYYRENNEGLTGSYHEQYMADQINAWQLFDEYADRWADSSDNYRQIISQRKALTCTIGATQLIYARLSFGIKRKRLGSLLNSPFYREYAFGDLPSWAPEEAVFVHGMQMSSRAYDKLLRSAVIHDVKAAVKKMIGR